MMSQHKQKRRFSPEFKLEAIEQVVKYQHAAADVARSLELDPCQLRKWIRQYKAEISGVTPANPALTPEQREVQSLRAQIKRLEMEKEIPKAGCRVDERNVRQICALITRLKGKWPVVELCRQLKITRSIYYALQQQRVDVKRVHLRSQARNIHQQSRGAAGSRMLSQLMCQKGYSVGRWLARRLMRECGLVSCQPGKHRYRGSREEAQASPNILKRQFGPAEANRIWSGDISYIRVNGGWCYLALVIDLYSRRVVGQAMSLSPDAELVCRAMRNALETRQRKGRLIFHSDQGGQYRSKKYRQLLWRYGVIQSMSRRGNCLDNSPMERVFRSLKSEWVPAGGYVDIQHAQRDIRNWVYNWYNPLRPHRHNNGLSPCEYENQWKEATRVS
ncbi:IS3 family transposase [Escherichia albertii]|nr:IS3 family transposase [Escherichia albertii]MCZ9085155.1 IS3 family transposase [Escherichia albertii]